MRSHIEVLLEVAHRGRKALVSHHPLHRLDGYACLGQQRGERAAQSVRRDPLDCARRVGAADRLPSPLSRASRTRGLVRNGGSFALLVVAKAL